MIQNAIKRRIAAISQQQKLATVGEPDAEAPWRSVGGPVRIDSQSFPAHRAIR